MKRGKSAWRAVIARVLLVAGWAFAALPARAAAANRDAEEMSASRVVILANSDDADSVRIARHYAEVRGVPEANIFALKMPLGKSIS
jgi:hypothetical protein